MPHGWDESAAAWIADMGEHGDFGRRYVLDAPMAARIKGRGFARALDVGCGEGRFCRIMQQLEIATVGIDPVPAMVAQARLRDPQGDYRVGDAEALDFGDNQFDLVVAYLTLIDIPDITRAIPEMARVMQPGGTLLIANLNSFASAGAWQDKEGDAPKFVLDNYLQTRGEWVSWRGINVHNWHRPLSAYMAPLLQAGLILRHFAEPAPHGNGDDAARAERYQRVPWYHIMEWQKPHV